MGKSQISVGIGKAGVQNTKAVISLNHGKIERKLLYKVIYKISILSQMYDLE